MKIVDKYNISQIIDTSIYTLISTRASEMSFYLLLAFFPFLIFTINIVKCTMLTNRKTKL